MDAKLILDRFVAELRGHFYAEALATLQQWPSPPGQSVLTTVTTAKQKTKAKAKGTKRTPADLERQATDLLRTLTGYTGPARIEELSAVMGVPTSELVLPMKKLLASKRVRKSGVRRATTYRVA